MDQATIQANLARYEWYHTIELAPGVTTPGWQPIVPLNNLIRRVVQSLDLRGKKVLDIGCRDGLFSLQAEQQGAAEVVGIDSDLSPALVNFLVPHFKSRLKLREMNCMDLKPETFGRFDVVFFFGVLYHLRYPFWSIKVLKDLLKEGGTFVIETAILADDNALPLLYCPVGQESPYEPTSCTFYNVKGLRDTLTSLGVTVDRVECLTRPTPAAELPSLAARLRHLLETPTQTPNVDRAVFVCRKTSEIINPTVDAYWHATHKIHTNQIGPEQLA